LLCKFGILSKDLQAQGRLFLTALIAAARDSSPLEAAS
jgi:hypothetical protein